MGRIIVWSTQWRRHIVTHEYFIPFLNKTKSYKTIYNIFTTTEQSPLKKCLESSCDVHEPWIELNEKSKSWKPKYEDSYGGPHGGSDRGPSSNIVKIARKVHYTSPLSLVPMTCFFSWVQSTVRVHHGRILNTSWVVLVQLLWKCCELFCRI